MTQQYFSLCDTTSFARVSGNQVFHRNWLFKQKSIFFQNFNLIIFDGPLSKILRYLSIPLFLCFFARVCWSPFNLFSLAQHQPHSCQLLAVTMLPAIQQWPWGAEVCRGPYLDLEWPQSYFSSSVSGCFLFVCFNNWSTHTHNNNANNERYKLKSKSL